jgi:hypothetical protein
LANKKAVVLAAVISVFAALRNHPDKQQLLIYDSFYPLNNGAVDIFIKMMYSSTTNPENYLVPLQFYHKEILKIAEELYDRLLRVSVNNTIYPFTSRATHQPDVIETN